MTSPQETLEHLYTFPNLTHLYDQRTLGSLLGSLLYHTLGFSVRMIFGPDDFANDHMSHMLWITLYLAPLTKEDAI